SFCSVLADWISAAVIDARSFLTVAMSAASLASRSLDSVTSLTTCSYSALLLSGSLAGSGASSAVDGESAASIRDRAASMPLTKQPAGLRLSDMGLVLAAASLTNHQPCPRAASFYVSSD